MNDIVHFPFSDSITKFHVANATLNFFIRGASKDGVLIDIYKVVRLGDHSDPPELERVKSWKEPWPPGRGGKWVQTDFTETVGEWFKNGKENLGFVINATVNGKKLAVTDFNSEKSKVSPWRTGFEPVSLSSLC